MDNKMKKLWQKMADMTFAKCKTTCKIKLGHCCSSEYCQYAASAMEAAGEKVPELPFVKNGACVIPSHFRPLCSLHQCFIHSLGFDPNDAKWTKEYFKLREKLTL